MPSKTTRDTAQIPVIDISDSNPDAARQLLEAAATYGFVFIKNNEAGIPPAEIDNMFELSRQFFQSPVSVKQQCSINSNKSGSNVGWISMHTETLDPGHQKRGDFKEAFNISASNPTLPPSPLSGPLAANSTSLIAFSSACHTLCERILHHFAVALALEPDWFTARHDRSKGSSGNILRLLYYPSIDSDDVGGEGEGGLKPDEDDIRAGAHSDYGSVTLLFQRRGQPGLEILTREGRWESVPVDPSSSPSSSPSTSPSTDGDDRITDEKADGNALPILVNIGDLLSYWTNNLLKSTVHRVIFPNPNSNPTSPIRAARAEDRYSIAYFCHPLDDAELVPVPSRMVQEYRADGVETAGKGMGTVKGRATITARDHLNERLAATYGIKTK